MKTVVSLLALTSLSAAVVASALAADTGRVSWKQANVQALHGADRAAVVRFVDDARPYDQEKLPSPNCVEGYGWIRTGGGNSDFAVLLNWSQHAYADYLNIYRPGRAGELKIQVIRSWGTSPAMPAATPVPIRPPASAPGQYHQTVREGAGVGLISPAAPPPLFFRSPSPVSPSRWNEGHLRNIIRDLNGDGIDELIISTGILAWRWDPVAGTPSWPAVYRLENGRYVEASRDFPSYYDTHVLPGLDKAIASAQSHGLSDSAAVSILVKDKILRVLGRNPVAGMNHAYRWMNSDDPTLMQCALATFEDIGGHQQEVQELQKALPGAVARAVEKSKSLP